MGGRQFGGPDLGALGSRRIARIVLKQGNC